MKNKLSIVIKMIIAGLLAFIVLNVLSMFYYNIPNRISNDDKTTDYKWPSESIYSRCTENISFGKMNNEGFHNIEDYDVNTSIDVLLMGGSHAEGLNVQNDEIISEVLNREYGISTYNIGISEHTLLHCAVNLDNALKKYKPKKYVVIETMQVGFNDSQIEAVLNNSFQKLPTFDNKILKIAQNFKYLKLVYYQYQNIDKKIANNALKSISDKSKINELIKYIKQICINNSVDCIIVFHPTLKVDNNMNVTVDVNEEDLRIMEEACTNNGINFINMEEDFINYYKENNILPHGFNNTIPGQGHLNRYGHMLIAERIKKEIEGN